MSELTKRQVEVLEYIINSTVRNGIPPTYREIGNALDIKSTNGVSEHVKTLVDKGFIERLQVGHGKARGLILTDKCQAPMERGMVSVPVLGNVAAGQPILAEEHVLETIRMDQSMTHGNKNVFALRVKGESMINEGILDGDTIIVKSQQTAEDGDIVVAVIDGEATVKFFFQERNRIRLQPANDFMEPIYVGSTARANISGKVIGVYRSYR